MSDTANNTPVSEPLVCGDCVHCQDGPNTKNDIMQRCCWRFPPVPVGVFTQKGLVIASVRPEIRVDTPACGEYETEDEESGMPTLAGNQSPGMTT